MLSRTYPGSGGPAHPTSGRYRFSHHLRVSSLAGALPSANRSRAIALSITLAGATLATAPLALADSQQVVARAHHWSSVELHRLASIRPKADSAARSG